MIDLVPTDEQLEIAATAAKAAQSLTSRSTDDLSDDELEALGRLTLFTLGLPAEAGGAGLGLAEEALVAVELGAALAPVGLLAALVGAHAAATSGDADLLDGIAAGRTRVGWVEPWTWVHDGEVTRWRAIDTGRADVVVVATPDGIALTERAAFEYTPVDVRFDRAATLAEATRTGATLTAADPGLLAHARLLVAAALLGNARRSMEMAVEYAKVREQFGVAIGTFQAVKHMCADMAVRIDAANAAIFSAAVTRDAGITADTDGISAKAVASDAALRNAETAIQVFGGIGVTAECDAHLYVRRANLLQQLLGPIEFHQEALVRHALARLDATPSA